MDKLKRNSRIALIRSIVISTLIAAALPLIITGALTLGKQSLFEDPDTVSIIKVVFGALLAVIWFYGTPISWVMYANYPAYKRMLSLIEDDHFYTVADIAMQLQGSPNAVRNSIYKLIQRGYLLGYKFDGEALTLNEYSDLRATEHSERCPYCAALVNFTGLITICPYCGGTIKYNPANKDNSNDANGTSSSD